MNRTHSAKEPVRFTPAEARVLQLLATYLTLEGIADRLGVRRATVKTHVDRIYAKLGATSRAQAIERAEAGGFLKPGLAAADRAARADET
jgi:DNA-binding NarL/FixJ family response regulator